MAGLARNHRGNGKGRATNISGIIPGASIKLMCDLCSVSLFTEWILINKWSLEGKWVDTSGDIKKNYKHVAFSLAIHHIKHTGKSFCFFLLQSSNKETGLQPVQMRG